MREVTDSFLLQVAEISATLIGLFLVGLLFYIETGFRRLGEAREVMEPYFRAGARIVLILYAIPLFLSLTLVVLGPTWNRLLFLLLSVLLVAANVDTIAHVRTLARVEHSGVWLVNEVIGSIAVLAIVIVPWALGGLHPSREDLTWAILLSLAAGFLSVGALVLSIFDADPYETAGGASPR
ncbi:MAG: hypothetical protein ACRDNP_05890 [Gaiellaceae bacterium]